MASRDGDHNASTDEAMTLAGYDRRRREHLFRQQAAEADRGRREALLHAIQRIAYERVMFVPILQQAQLNGVGPRVELPGSGLVEHIPFLMPYEDLRLK
jgi:hypothetical protein